VSAGKLTGIEAATLTPYAKLLYQGRELKKLPGEEVSITRRYLFPNGGIAIPCGDGAAAN
jgi:uncharacterized protein (DUF3820 family)